MKMHGAGAEAMGKTANQCGSGMEQRRRAKAGRNGLMNLIYGRDFAHMEKRRFMLRQRPVDKKTGPGETEKGRQRIDRRRMQGLG